jgi:hypothetical protein
MMMDKADHTGDIHDPKGLIREAYRIDAITASQCRSIFLDWALSLPAGRDADGALRDLLARHAANAPDHPMSEVLRQGLTKMTNPRRRGGWRARARN